MKIIIKDKFRMFLYLFFLFFFPRELIHVTLPSHQMFLQETTTPFSKEPKRNGITPMFYFLGCAECPYLDFVSFLDFLSIDAYKFTGFNSTQMISCV